MTENTQEEYFAESAIEAVDSDDTDDTEEIYQDSSNSQETNGNDQEPAGASSGSQSRTWYPYITKVQFEKFLSRLENKTPEVIDRDYIRAIIRTPSMIHRFLRGIEAMQLIDRDQRPTDRMRSLVDPDTRRHTLAEVLRGLYGGILEQWQQSEGKMDDQEITAFFRNTTGMGNDSANKMKMFFKYLVSEADFSPPAERPARPIETPAPHAPAPHAAAPEPPPPARGRQRPQDRSPDNSSGRSDKPQPRKQMPEKQAPAPVQQTAQVPPPSERQSNYNGRPLSEVQKAYLETVKGVLEIKIDGDWDDDMIRLAFDRLERLFDRVKRG